MSEKNTNDKSNVRYLIVNYDIEDETGKRLQVRLRLSEEDIDSGRGEEIVKDKYPTYEILSMGRSSGLFTKEGIELYQGDTVKTKERGYEVVLYDGGRFLIGRKTEMLDGIMPGAEPLEDWNDRCTAYGSYYTIIDLTSEDF